MSRELLCCCLACHLARDFDPATQEPLAGTDLWTDYAGDVPYGDYTVDSEGGFVEEQTRYLDANGPQARQSATGVSNTTTYHHADLGSSHMMTTNAAGVATTRTSYTAFGEAVGGGVSDPSAIGTRYQYAGGWGYEAGLISLSGASGTEPIRLSHAGGRWYDASSGRSVLRTPIGIHGTSNVYSYFSEDPCVDPPPGGYDWRVSQEGWDSNYRAFLRATGGCGTSYLDRVGRNLGQKSTVWSGNGVYALGGARTPKFSNPLWYKFRPFGPAGMTSVWTKIPGANLSAGMWMGRLFIPFTLLEGAWACFDIVSALREES